MSLESKIDAAVQEANRGTAKPTVASWSWTDRDLLRCRSQWVKGMDLTTEEVKILYSFVGDPYDIADMLILEASATECLTSSSEYVRERKKLFLKEDI